MNQGNDHNAASGLLTELDDIRSLLDESLPDDAIPVLEDAVEGAEADFPIVRDAAAAETELPLEPAELARIPLLDDPIPDFGEDDLEELADDEPFAGDDAFGEPSFEQASASREGPAPFPPGATVAELLAAQELQTAVRNRIDETLERWVNETLQQELTLLRARLLEAVRAEVHEYVAAQINRANVTGKPHGE